MNPGRWPGVGRGWCESGLQPWEVMLAVTTTTSHEATLSTVVGQPWAARCASFQDAAGCGL